MTKGGINGNVHHCCECKQPVRARCIRLGHVAACEVLTCKGFFQIYKGCTMHPYSEGYNVEAQKQQKGRKRSLCIDVDEANDAVNPNPENLEMIVQPENCRTEDADDPSSRENEKPAEGEPVKLNKPNFVKKPDSLSKIPEGGWNQDGLEVQPHGSKKRDKRSIHKAATAQQKKNKTRKDRHSI